MANTSKRLNKNISMKFFREGSALSPDGVSKPRNFAFEVLKSADEGRGPLMCGVVIGRITGFKRKENTLKDGTITNSVMLAGHFEATRAIDGAVMRAPAIYLPPLYAEPAEHELQAGATSIEFALEVLAEATEGQGVSYQWVLQDIYRTTGATPLDHIRAQMEPHPLVAGSGQPLPSLQAPAEQRAIAAPAVSDSAQEELEAAQEQDTQEAAEEANQQAPGEAAQREEAKHRRRRPQAA